MANQAQQSSFWDSPLGKLLVKAQEKTQPIASQAQSAGQGIINSQTYGLYQPNVFPVENKGAYSAGYVLGMLNPLNPINKILGLSDVVIGKALSKFAPSAVKSVNPLTKILTKVVAPEAAQTGLMTAGRAATGQQIDPINDLLYGLAGRIAFGSGTLRNMDEVNTSGIKPGGTNYIRKGNKMMGSTKITSDIPYADKNLVQLPNGNWVRKKSYSIPGTDPDLNWAKADQANIPKVPYDMAQAQPQKDYVKYPKDILAEDNFEFKNLGGNKGQTPEVKGVGGEGVPKKLYHGTYTGNKFDVFDEGKFNAQGHNAANQGDVFYTTDSKEAARYFSMKANEGKSLRDQMLNPVPLDQFSSNRTPGEVLEFELKPSAKIAELDYYPNPRQIAELKKQGFDGATFKEEGFIGVDDYGANVPKGSRTTAIWNKNAIESPSKGVGGEGVRSSKR